MSTSLLELRDVSLHIPGLEKPILDNIQYQVYPQDFIIILGSNGSGKSSLMKLMDRRYLPTEGQIFLNGTSIQTYGRSKFSKDVITLTQNPHDSLFTSLTVFENYLMVKQRHDSARLRFNTSKERHFFQNYLAEFSNNLPNKMEQLVEKLSGGEKQALGLALSVLHPPKILLLDEHTSALDPKIAAQLMSLTQQVVTEHQITCILTTHDLDIARHYGNRVLALKQGKIFQMIDYDKKELVTQDTLLSVCY